MLLDWLEKYVTVESEVPTTCPRCGARLDDFDELDGQAKNYGAAYVTEKACPHCDEIVAIGSSAQMS